MWVPVERLYLESGNEFERNRSIRLPCPKKEMKKRRRSRSENRRNEWNSTRM
jgi:hypothetical protein